MELQMAPFTKSNNDKLNDTLSFKREACQRKDKEANYSEGHFCINAESFNVCIHM